MLRRRTNSYYNKMNDDLLEITPRTVYLLISNTCIYNKYIIHIHGKYLIKIDKILNINS